MPVTAVLVLVLWLTVGFAAEQTYFKLLIFAASAYLMVEMNNRNALIRIYSRMVSCSFLVLATMAASLFGSIDIWAVQFWMIASCTTLLSCYQDKRAVGRVFYAFLFIGIASIFFIQVLFFVPFMWVMMRTNLMSFSMRGLLASVFGLLTPYWLLAGYYLFNGDIMILVAHITSIADFSPLFRYDLTNIHEWATFGFIALISITGIVHFLRNSYKDKIRTRMIYEMFIFMTILIFIFVVLQPQHILPLMSILLINASVLIAHYIALTGTRITNISFFVIIFLTLLMTVYNIWIH